VNPKPGHGSLGVGTAGSLGETEHRAYSNLHEQDEVSWHQLEAEICAKGIPLKADKMNIRRTDRRFVAPTAEMVAPMEPEDLSRFEGEATQRHTEMTGEEGNSWPQ
jgi:hypothetical protein